MIDIHADDYALTENTSKEMLECMLAGKLNSISIVPNTGCFETCMDRLYAAIPSMPFLPCMSIHINLVEGLSLADSGLGPYLGFSWGELFKHSYIQTGSISTGIKMEIAAQIKKCTKAIDKCLEIARTNNVKCSQKGLRIDSHQHTHHLPVIWKAITAVIEENKYEVEYIRNSREPLGVFLSAPELYRTYRPINAVKNRVLTMYSRKIDKYCEQRGIKKMYLWGLVMSGKMDYERVSRLRKAMERKAESSGRDLEILFHPGRALPDEMNEEFGSPEANEFYMSSNRTVERDALMKLR